MHLHVYMNRRLLCVETNLAWALPYWCKRKQDNKNINWRIVK
jgi:hypothetical protein